MLFDAPVDILDMRKCSISSATRQLTRTASRTVLDAVNSMNSALSGSRTELGTEGESTPKEGSFSFSFHLSPLAYLFPSLLWRLSLPFTDNWTIPFPYYVGRRLYSHTYIWIFNNFIAGSIQRPAPFRRFYSSPQLIPKKSPQSPPSSSPPMEDSTRRSSTLPRQSVVSIALAQRMRLLSNLSLSLTNLEPTKDWSLSSFIHCYFFCCSFHSLRSFIQRVSILSWSLSFNWSLFPFSRML